MDIPVTSSKFGFTAGARNPVVRTFLQWVIGYDHDIGVFYYEYEHSPVVLSPTFTFQFKFLTPNFFHSFSFAVLIMDATESVPNILHYQNVGRGGNNVAYSFVTDFGVSRAIYGIPRFC